MCGIAGQVDFAGPVAREGVERMSAALEHRGPDSHGAHFEPGVGLAARRLAIIDVAGGDQPIFNEDRSVVVVMNGEIYNFQELREGLEAGGHRFTTRSDTEVLVHLYEDRGPDLVDELRGMFAFAIWDRPRRRLVCARDRVGKKPLFWARRGSRVWFASELQALLQDPTLPREVDFEAIEAYLGLGYVPHPLTAFKAIRKLPPATVMVLGEGGRSLNRYWSLDYEPKLEAPEPELEERLRDLLDEAVRVRMVSEVPLGALLSGGIDSSSVVASMAEHSPEPVKTFSIGFSDADYDELRFARLTAERFGTDHHELVVEPDAVSVLPRLVRHYGEPFADPSAIPSFYLAEMTSAHVTVALNGDGGDESFAGYPRYARTRLVAGLDRVPVSLRRLLKGLRALPGGRASASSAASRARRLALTAAMDIPQRYHDWMAPFGAMARERLLRPELRDGAREYPASAIVDKWQATQTPEPLDRLLDVDVHTYLPDDLLVKMDIATMAHSVEARSPLLDQELMAFAARLPARLKLRAMRGKRIFKRALKGRLPDPVLEREKQGFSVPLARWLREELSELPGTILLDPGARTASWFQSGVVERMVTDHAAGTADHALGLWALVQLELWSRMVGEAPTPSPTPAHP